MDASWSRAWWWLVWLTGLVLALGWGLVLAGVDAGPLDQARMFGLTWRGLVGLGALRLALVWLFPTPPPPTAFPSPYEHPMRHWYVVSQAVSPGLCQRLIDAAEALPWTQKRHTVATQDQPLARLGPLAKEVDELLAKQLFAEVAARYELPLACVGLREAFVVKYDATEQSHLPYHRDASILTLSIALNPASGYKGGGTHFPCIDHTISLTHTGDVLLHCGKIQHGGRHVQRGQRYILVCFLDLSACPAFDHDEIATWDSLIPDDYAVMARIYSRF